MLTFYFIHSSFDGDDMVNIDWTIVKYIRSDIGAQRNLIIRSGVGEGIFRGSICRDREVQQKSKAIYGVYNVFRN